MANKFADYVEEYENWTKDDRKRDKHSDKEKRKDSQKKKDKERWEE